MPSDPMERAAARAGMALSEYKDQFNLGKLWCSRCRDFHPDSEFGISRANLSGKDNSCLRSNREARRAQYQAARKQKGLIDVPADSDRRARERQTE